MREARREVSRGQAGVGEVAQPFHHVAIGTVSARGGSKENKCHFMLSQKAQTFSFGMNFCCLRIFCCCGSTAMIISN
jgi:hypothetical protein